jgi:dephospho-CoA kinase
LFHGKPIIGITGGIGSGKTTVAAIFGEMGCLVIGSDAQVEEVYRDPAVIAQLAEWWGAVLVKSDGQLNKGKIADIVFGDSVERTRLERLLHPRVAALRDARMAEAGNNSQVKAIVWDTPLLYETGLHSQCDAVVFVEASAGERMARVTGGRGWNEAELARREKSQWPLDKKREISDYIIANTADADEVRGQVRQVLFRILAK